MDGKHPTPPTAAGLRAVQCWRVGGRVAGAVSQVSVSHAVIAAAGAGWRGRAGVCAICGGGICWQYC